MKVFQKVRGNNLKNIYFYWCANANDKCDCA